MLDWLIVGGGLQGNFIAGALADAAPATNIAVLDARDPLDAWQQRAAACGMRYLRSPGAHHLGRRGDALRVFAAAQGYDDRHRLGYYRRPSRTLFETHTATTLAALPRIRATATAIERCPAGWTVHDDTGGTSRAAHIVLALGPGRPYRPAWAAHAEHVYDADFAHAPATSANEHIAVIGGGITGAQLALRCLDTGYRVDWLTRGQPRATAFDSDPCYAGRLCLEPFARTPISQRTRLLADARQPGTLPPDIHARITAAIAGGQIGWHRGTVHDLDDAGLRFTDGGRRRADRVVLATGFDPQPEPGGLLDRCIRQLDLMVDKAGHLFIDTDLAAAPGLHIVGRPASLQLGPMAGNIRGARIAGRVLAACATDEQPWQRSPTRSHCQEKRGRR